MFTEPRRTRTSGPAPSRATYSGGLRALEFTIKQAVASFLDTLAEFLPKLIGFVLILVIGLIVAKLISKAVDKLLEKIGFDTAVERGGVKQALSKSKLDPSDIVGKLVHYALALLVLQMAFGVFGPNPVSELITQVITFIPSLVVAIVIVVVAAAIAAAVKSLVEGALGGLSYGKPLANIASAFVLFLGVIAALNQVGVATTVTTPVLVAILATVSGVLIVGVGGGLIKPMQARWEGYLSKAEAEAPKMRQQTGAPTGTSVRAQSDPGSTQRLSTAAKAPADAPYDREADAPTTSRTTTSSTTPGSSRH